MIGKFMRMVLIFPLALPAAAQELSTAPAQADLTSKKQFEILSFELGADRCSVSQGSGVPMLFATVAMTGGAAVDSLKPISNVGIVVKKNPGGSAERTTSGSDGSYAFDDLAPGSYTLSAAGRQPLQVTVGRDGKLHGTITEGGGTAATESLSLNFSKIEYKGISQSDERVAAPQVGSAPHIRLTFDIGPPGPDGVTPIVMKHAINTKGTGSNNGRQAASTPVACDSAGAGGRTRGKATYSDINMVSAGGAARCTVSAANDMPVFDIALPVGSLSRKSPAGGGMHRVDVMIVPTGARPDLPTLATCDSTTAGKPSKASWNLKGNVKV